MLHFIGNAIIGKNVSMDKESYINSGIIANAKIGRYCSIAYNVIIGPTEHNTQAPSMSPYSAEMAKLNLVSNLPNRLVVLDDEVWVSANSVILQGVHIGKGSVIAAGAGVTKDIPSMEILGGVSAQKIKDRCIICTTGG